MVGSLCDGRENGDEDRGMLEAGGDYLWARGGQPPEGLSLGCCERARFVEEESEVGCAESIRKTPRCR